MFTRNTIMAALLALSAGLMNAQSTALHTIFSETFENPVVPSSPGFLRIENGLFDFDNSGWSITNPDNDNGVLLFSADRSFAPANPDSQILTLGADQDSDTNGISTLISGFHGSSTAYLSFEAIVFPITGQELEVIIQDASNGETLLHIFTPPTPGITPFNNLAFAVPASDEILLSINQSGNSFNSDSAVDNILVTVPEPSLVSLLLLSLVGSACRRNRNFC